MKRRSVVRGLYREDLEEYPGTALREVVINALVHRDLSHNSRGTPVQVQKFPDRLVIINPGGLYGPITVDSLGQEGISSPRNNTMVRLLEDVSSSGERQAICENRGSGVGAMLASLQRSGLPNPAFDNKIASFRVTLFNTAPERLQQRRDRRDEIVTILRNAGDLSRAEISQHLGLTEGATRKWLTVLRQQRIVETTEQKARSKNVKYRLSRRRAKNK
jgi:predicted HTH transcriptional regulator